MWRSGSCDNVRIDHQRHYRDTCQIKKQDMIAVLKANTSYTLKDEIRKTERPLVLRLIRCALKKDGVFYASFKYGETERVRSGRVFSDFTETPLRSLLEETGGVHKTALWIIGDARSGRADERWIKAVLRWDGKGGYERTIISRRR